MKFLNVVLATFLVVTLGYTTYGVVSPPPDADQVLGRPGRLLSQLQEGQGKLRDLKGLVDVVLNAREERYAGKAVLVLRENGSIRLEPLNFFGQPLLYIVVNKGVLSAYNPSRNEYFRGRATIENLYNWLGVPLTSKEIVEVLLGGFVPRLMDGNLHARWDGTVGNEGAYNLQVTEGSKVKRQWWFDARSLIPLRFQLVSRLRDENLKVIYSGYRKEGNLRFPSSVKVEVGRGERTLEIHYGNVKLNQNLPPLAFHLPIPSGVSIIPLGR